MAKSKFEYVKRFEKDETLLPNTWVVMRLDGRGFHKFSKAHNFAKPNDARALSLMNAAAVAVMDEFHDIVLGYGESDEFSFVFRKEMTLWNRRSAKILTALVSFFTANYVMLWPQYMQSPSGKPELLQYPPQFDGRLVVYPSRKNIRDYLSWRQADCHINNLFNTCFWKLVLDGGKTPIEAEGILSKTLSNEKNEILFSQFGVNYNNEPAMFRRGSILLRRTVLVDKVVGGNGVSADNDCDSSASPVSDDPSRQKVAAEDSASPNPRRPSPGTVIKVKRKRVAVVHDDLISDTFWSENEDIFPREG